MTSTPAGSREPARLRPPLRVRALVVRHAFSQVLDGRNADLADGVQRALGRAPRDFSDYVRDAAATGVWNGSALAA